MLVLKHYKMVKIFSVDTVDYNFHKYEVSQELFDIIGPGVLYVGGWNDNNITPNYLIDWAKTREEYLDGKTGSLVWLIDGSFLKLSRVEFLIIDTDRIGLDDTEVSDKNTLSELCFVVAKENGIKWSTTKPGDIVMVQVNVIGVVDDTCDYVNVLPYQQFELGYDTKKVVKLGNKEDHQEDNQYYEKSRAVKACQYTGDAKKIDDFTMSVLGYTFIDWDKASMSHSEWIVIYFGKDGVSTYPVIMTNDKFKEKFER